MQEHRESQRRHAQAPHPAEEEAEADEAGPLVIAGGELGHERRTRDLVEGDEDAHQDRGDQQIAEQQGLAEAAGRREQQQIGQRDRDRRAIHERVPPSPGRAQPVRQIANGRVHEAVDDQRDHDGQSRQPRVQPQRLIVEQEQKDLEAVVLDAEGHRADAVEQLDRQPSGAAARRLRACRRDRRGYCRHDGLRTSRGSRRRRKRASSAQNLSAFLNEACGTTKTTENIVNRPVLRSMVWREGYRLGPLAFFGGYRSQDHAPPPRPRGVMRPKLTRRSSGACHTPLR